MKKIVIFIGLFMLMMGSVANLNKVSAASIISVVIDGNAIPFVDAIQPLRMVGYRFLFER